VVVPCLVAIGSAYLVWFLMQARIQVLTANFQAAVAKVECDRGDHRPGLEELLSELRMERRRFMRRIPGPKGLETTVITQERIFLRNLPLTGWMQDELVLGEGQALDAEGGAIPLVGPSGVQTVALPSAPG
jgi:hypothetical protein